MRRQRESVKEPLDLQDCSPLTQHSTEIDERAAIKRRFDNNFSDAQALLQFHTYLDDLIDGGGRRTIGFLSKALSSSEALTFDSKECRDQIVWKGLLCVLRNTNARRTSETIRRTVNRIKDRIRTHSSRDYQKTLTNVERIHDQLLLELAVAHVVTAFEVYRKDSILLAVDADPSSIKRLELDKQVAGRVESEMNDCDCERGEALVRVGLRAYSVYRPERVAELYQLILNKESILSNLSTRGSDDHMLYKYIMEIRHLIVHKKCIVDDSFREETGRLDVEVNKRLPLREHDVGRWIHFIDTIVTSIDSALQEAVG